VKIYKKDTDLMQPKIQIVIKMPKSRALEMQSYELYMFKNEVYFYNVISRYFTDAICPQYYIATTNLKDYKQPIIVMQDLSDYNNIIGILDEDAKKEYMRLVAFFHANGMRLINENSEVCKKIFSCLKKTNKRREMARENLAAR